MHEVAVTWVNSVRIMSVIRTDLHWLLVRRSVISTLMSSRTDTWSLCLTTWLTITWTHSRTSNWSWTGNLYRFAHCTA